MFYINDRTGEKITKLFEQKKLNSDEYFNIMEYLSMDIFRNFHKRTDLFADIFNKLNNIDNNLRKLIFLRNSYSIAMDMKKILLVDYIHKLADMITMRYYLDKDSMRIMNNKKILSTIIEKIDKAEADGFVFNRQKLDIIEQQFERV